MNRFVQWSASMLLLAGTALHAGCGSSAGLATGSTGEGPSISNEDPMARPVHVAWTSARAKRCGFNFDPLKLRTNYLAYESKQGASGEAFIKIERTYDSTFKSISERVSADPNYCTDKKGAEIKAELGRHLAGDYAPNFPKPKVVAKCGGLFDPCDSGRTEEPFESKKFWTERDKNPGTVR
jgi:hypothetical protein